ncbi:MAG: ABC transporter permease subunit [Actinomycetes bacterium]
MRRTAPAVLTAFMGLLLVVLAAGAGPAYAQGEALLGTITNKGKPVQGVEVRVQSSGGQEVGKDTTDAQGRWEVAVDQAGDYRVEVVEDSLPEGVGLRNPDNNPLTVPVFEGQPRTVLFPLGEGTRDVENKWEQGIQLAVEGLQFGLIIAMGAIGLSLIFGTTGLVNFAHGELVTLGALICFWINVDGGIHLIPAAILAIALSGALGWAQDKGMWGVLRRRGTGLIAMLVVSIGLSLFLRFFFLYLFGGSTRAYDQYQAQAAIDLGPISLAPKGMVSIALSTAVLVAVGLALLKTRIGKATRAVADNPALAEASGIDVERVIRIVWIAGAGLAGLGGILLGVSQLVSFQMGFQILLLVFAAVILGGLGTAFGALVGSLVVGVFVQVSTLWVPPELKNVGALMVLIVILLIRPQGILGRAERVG